LGVGCYFGTSELVRQKCLHFCLHFCKNVCINREKNGKIGQNIGKDGKAETVAISRQNKRTIEKSTVLKW